MFHFIQIKVMLCSTQDNSWKRSEPKVSILETRTDKR